MSVFLKYVLNISHYISLIVGLLIAGLGIIYEFVGYNKFQNFFANLGLSNPVEKMLCVGMVMVVVFFITFVIRVKLSTK